MSAQPIFTVVTDDNLIGAIETLLSLSHDALVADADAARKVEAQYERGLLTVQDAIDAFTEIVATAAAMDLRAKLCAGSRTPMFAARLAAIAAKG